MYSDPKFVTERLSYAVSVIGFGADPKGLVDSGAAFAAAIEACRERNYSTLHVPAGTYVISSFSPEGSGCAGGEKVGWCLSNLNGLCIRGDGAFRSGAADETGTTIEFRFPVAGGVGIGIKGCTALRFENLTINGAEHPAVVNPAIGVRIQPSGDEEPVRSRGIQFQNCSFRWCEIVVQTTASPGNSELSFYDCAFGPAGIGFQSFDNSSVAHQFIGCTGGGSAAANNTPFQGMETMFDLRGGGKITVVGFGGGPVKTLVKVGAGNGSIGWNVLQNVRLEQFGGKTTEPGRNTWGIDNRTQFYDADAPSDGASGQRTLFDGIIVTPPGITPPGSDVPADDGTPRFALLNGHTVILRNAGPTSYPLATAISPLLEFKAGETPGGTFRAFNVSVPLDARLDRLNVPPLARYSFHECSQFQGSPGHVPYPDRLHPPLYGPNYLMSVEYHCWEVGEALVGVNKAAAGSGNDVIAIQPSDTARAGVIESRTLVNGHAALMSHVAALRPSLSTWRYQGAARVTAVATNEGATEFVVRLGFGDSPSGESTNGVYFRYDNDVGVWEGVIRWQGQTPGVLTTAKTLNTAWHTFEIELQSDGEVATFYMDGERLGTASCGPDPRNLNATGLMPLQFVRVGGTGTKSAEIDYYKYEIRPESVGEMFPE